MVRCDPHAGELQLLAANPMSRVPTLVMDDGSALFDSPVIRGSAIGSSTSPTARPWSRRGPAGSGAA